MKQSARTLVDASPVAYEVDETYGVPLLVRLRTIHILALAVGALSIAAAIEWPRAWQLVVLSDLAAISFLFALAAGREWLLRAASHRSWSLSWSSAQRAAAWHVRPLLEDGASSVAAGSTY